MYFRLIFLNDSFTTVCLYVCEMDRHFCSELTLFYSYLVRSANWAHCRLRFGRKKPSNDPGFELFISVWWKNVFEQRSKFRKKGNRIFTPESKQKFIRWRLSGYFCLQRQIFLKISPLTGSHEWSQLVSAMKPNLAKPFRWLWIAGRGPIMIDSKSALLSLTDSNWH